MIKKEIQKMIFDNIKKFVAVKGEGNYTVSGISRKFNIDRKSARKYIKSIKEGTDPTPKREIVAYAETEIEQYRDKIIQKLNNGVKIKHIYDFLKESYDVKFCYQSLTRWVRLYNKKQVLIKSKQAKIIYEKYPASQAQVDWKENMTLYTKENKKIVFNVFLIKLSFSRKVSLHLTFDKKQDTVFKCLLKAFEKFGGVPKQIVFDNMKTVVYEPSSTNREDYIINEKFKQFAKDCKFEVYACKAYRPETKGKVESLAKCIDELKVYNNEFNTEEELEKLLEKLESKINNRISSSTGFAPDTLYYKYELELLASNRVNPLISRYYIEQTVDRKVNNIGLISYGNNMYSVPLEYIGKVVNVKVKSSCLNIYYEKEIIACHQLCLEDSKNKKVISKDHLIELYKSQNLFDCDAEKIMNAAKETLDVLKLFNK